MELRIKDYIIRPDNWTTWSLTKLMTTKEWENAGNTYEGNTIYPKDLKTCILRIREDMRRGDKSYGETLEQFSKDLQRIDNTLMSFIEKAIIDFNNK